jgi:hypothetical protein
MNKILLITCLFIIQTSQAEMPKILPLKDQAAVIDRLLEEKINTVLPQLMALICGL